MANPYKIDNGAPITQESCPKKGCEKLPSYDWLSDLPPHLKQGDFVEVQFKNTRKGYYLNSEHLPLKKGDRVAVETSPGHDIGIVSMMGNLVLKRMQQTRVNPQEIKRIFRIATSVDMEKFEKAKEREHPTMIESRRIAAELGLKMKIGDVEYLGDGNKAIFYYIADERVDFRTLIKILAQTFHIRIEMKQIGARQEAGRIGGIGPCGRALCCAQWLTTFRSVNTAAARFQDLSMNPQKLTGQCGKLKCCTNYEVNTYMEARKKMPSMDILLQTQQGRYKAIKADSLSGMITYAPEKGSRSHSLVTIHQKRAFEVIHLNQKEIIPENLHDDRQESVAVEPSLDILDANSITRFDKEKSAKKRKRKPMPNGRPQSANANPKKPSADSPAPTSSNQSSRNKPRQPMRDRRPGQGKGNPSERQSPRPQPVQPAPEK